MFSTLWESVEDLLVMLYMLFVLLYFTLKELTSIILFSLTYLFGRVLRYTKGLSRRIVKKCRDKSDKVDKDRR